MEVRSPHDGSVGVDHGATASSGSSRPDPGVARLVADALGGARTVLNVGAGSGTYERAVHAVHAVADLPPFADGAYDGAMALFSVHEWADAEAGLREMRRVTRGPVVVLTCDPATVRDFWLYEYAPEVLDTEARRYPSIEKMAACLGGVEGPDGTGGTCEVQAVPIPWNCTDGFNEAYYGRPEMLLDPAARQACSAWSFVDDGVRERFTTRLRADLDSGLWDARFGHLRRQAFYQGSLVLIRATGQDDEEHDHGRA